MKKTFPAILAAILITAILGAGMLFVGLETQTSANAAAPQPTLSSDATIQFQQVLVQYQTREAQYQQELTNAANRITADTQQIELANQQIQQYQSILTQLQSSGLITIANDGTVTVNQMPTAPQGRHQPGDNH